MTVTGVKPGFPTEKQYEKLRMLGSGNAWVCGKRRDVEPFLRRAWVTAEYDPETKTYPYSWIRITPEGLRALAVGVERYGLPAIGPKPQVWRHYCGKCGSTRIYGRMVDAERELPEHLS